MKISVQVASWTRGLAAWSPQAPAVKDLISTERKNQYGTVYYFKDGTSGFVRKGSARLTPR